MWYNIEFDQTFVYCRNCRQTFTKCEAEQKTKCPFCGLDEYGYTGRERRELKKDA